MQKISIDPITRLEGHGRIDIFLDDGGDVANAYLVIPELRGFEKFAEGRPVEELPRITPRICGVCPTSHSMAAVLALDGDQDVALGEVLDDPVLVADPDAPERGLRPAAAAEQRALGVCEIGAAVRMSDDFIVLMLSTDCNRDGAELFILPAISGG